MAFQIVYIFKALDKFTRVAKKVERSVGSIEQKITKTGKKFRKFQKRGMDAFAKISSQALIAVNSLEKVTGAIAKIPSNIPVAVNSIKRLTQQTKKATVVSKFMAASISNLKFRVASYITTMALAGFGMNRLIEKGKEINSSFYNLSALTGISGKNLAFLKEEAFKFARVIGLPAKDIFTAFKRVAGLKPELLKDVNALKEMAKWTLILDAPMNKIEKVSRALTVALNVYGKSAKNAAEFSNILAAAQRFGSAEVIDLALSFLKAGPVARETKIPFIDLIAAFEGLARGGLLAQISGTSFRTLLIRLKKAGYDFEQLGLVGVFEKIGAELDAIQNPTQRAWKEFQLFGMRQQAAGLIMKRVIPLVRDLKQEIKGTNIAVETANVSLKEYGKRLKGIESISDKVVDKVFGDMEEGLLNAQEQFAIFLKGIDLAVPGGVGQFINAILNLTSSLLRMANVALYTIGVLTLPLELIDGWDAFVTKSKNLTELWKLIAEPRPVLSDILTSEELKVGGQTGANGRVSVDVNLRGNTEAISSVQAIGDGDVDISLGKNLGFIG